MIIVLNDQLTHLRHRVVVSAAHMTGNIRNFCPDHHTALVAKIVKILIVLIVRKSDGICADLTNEIHILKVMLGKKRIADLPSVLMTADTVERIFLSVENKTGLSINTEGTAAETRGYLIDFLAPANDRYLCRVEIGINSTVPKVYVLNRQNGACGCTLTLCDCISVCIKNAKRYLVALFHIVYVGVNFYIRRSFSDLGCNNESLAAEIFKIKMRFLYTNDVYVTVNTAVEGEIRHLRINFLVGSVIYQDTKRILRAEITRDIHTPSGISTVVMRKTLAVHIHVGRGIRTVYLKIVFFCFREQVGAEHLSVKASATEIVVSAVLTVGRIPSMRNRDGFSYLCGAYLGYSFEKLPIIVKFQYLSHNAFSL